MGAQTVPERRISALRGLNGEVVLDCVIRLLLTRSSSRLSRKQVADCTERKAELKQAFTGICIRFPRHWLQQKTGSENGSLLGAECATSK